MDDDTAPAANDVAASTQETPAAFQLPGLNTVPTSGKPRRGPTAAPGTKVDPFNPNGASVDPVWNPFGGNESQEQLKARATFSSKEKPASLKPGAADIFASDPFATGKSNQLLSTQRASQFMDDKALEKARREALEASNLFASAMEDDSNFSVTSPEKDDADFFSQLESRRKAREADEAARAEALRQAFLEKKRSEDDARAKEHAEIETIKQQELQLALQKKVRPVTLIHASTIH